MGFQKNWIIFWKNYTGIMNIDVDIAPEHYQIINDILNQHLPTTCTVWAFGSRVNHTAQKFSDLDLALEAGAKLDYSIITQLNRSFEESRLPYTVDVVDLNSVEPYFRQIINQQKIAFPLSGSL